MEVIRCPFYKRAMVALLLLAASRAIAEDLGSIEGDIVIHSKPLAGVEVMLMRQFMEPRKHIPQVKTDANGHFRFDQVQPGEYAVGHLLMYDVEAKVWSSRSGTDTYRRHVIVGPGEHVVVPPYPAGHTLRGRMVLPAGSTLDVAWQGASMRHIYTQTKHRPKSTPGMTPEESKKAFEEWRQSRAFKKEWVKGTKIVVDVHPDGSFEVQDVPPGDYVLNIEVGENSDKEHAMPPAWLYTEFKMRKKDVDLGELTVKVREEKP